MPIVINGTGSLTGLANEPAFNVYQTTVQSHTSTTTKCAWQVKDFDPTSAFDIVTNQRFTPLMAGYYHVGWRYQVIATTTILLSELRKNGTLIAYGSYNQSGETNPVLQGSNLVFMNGTTDYLELWINSSITGNSGANRGANCFFGFLVRAG